MDLQLDITTITQQLLQKEASEKNLPISKLVSNLIENYFEMRKKSAEKVESPKELLLRIASEAPTLSISEEKSMDEIVTEIKTYRKEKETPLELLYRFAAESPELHISEDEMMNLINTEINAAKD